MLTLVFTDLADSTALKTRHGDSAADSLVTRHQSLVTRLAADCSGRIIDWAGDGCFLTFEISSAGVIFALRLQQAHAEEPDLPGVRIGIHHGEVTEKPGTSGGPPRVGGLAVDLASRICGLAKPGQVLMSSAVYNSARQRLGVEAFGQPVLWQTHGTYALKGFDEPLDIGEAALEGLTPLEAPTSGDKAKLIRRAKRPAGFPQQRRFAVPSLPRPAIAGLAALVIVFVASLVYFTSRSGIQTLFSVVQSDPINSLAILPLQNLSNDPKQDYLADGLTEAITSELSKIKALKVSSRTSAMRFKDSQLSMPDIAVQLGVEGLIEGSVQREDDIVTVNVRLIHGPSDKQVWSYSSADTVSSVLQLQSRIALAIATSLKAEISGEERRRIETTRAVSPAAHDSFIIGLHYFDQTTTDGFRTSIKYFEDATKADPNFAEAWALLGRSHAALAFSGEQEPREAIPTARAAYMRALELDGNLVWAHSGLAQIASSYDWEWAEAEEHFRRALELAPNDPQTHVAFAWHLSFLGRVPEARQHAAMALDLDPKESLIVRNALAIYLDAGETEFVRDRINELLESQPDNVPALNTLVFAYLTLGDYEKAQSAVERELQAGPDDTWVRVDDAVVAAFTGNASRAREIISEVMASGRYVDLPTVATAYALLGDFDTAFNLLNEGVESRAWGLLGIRTLPYWGPFADAPNLALFRNDTRYRELLDRMKFPPLPPDHPGYADEQAWLAKKKAAAEANAPIRSLAVLPLENFSNDPDQEYFADGMTEAITSELSKIKALRVISRTSVMKYKKTDRGASEIAMDLRVDGLIAGSVQREGDDVKITVTLINGANDNNLWTHEYSDKITSVLALQSEVALAIAEALKAELTPDELARATRPRSVKPEAYDEYLLGLQARELGTREGIMASVGHFNRATQLDPEFADAWGRLGQAYCLIAGSGALDPGDLFPRARAAGQRALALDGDLPSAHNALGICALMYDWEWEVARTHFQTSVNIDPNGVFGNLFLSTYLMWMGRSLEGAPYATKALELGSADPWVVVTGSQLLSTAGRPTEAKAYLERASAARPDFVPLLIQLSAIYETTGEQENAERMIARAAEIDGGSVSSLLRSALVAAEKGNVTEAQLLLEKALGASEYVEPGYVYPVYVQLGDSETAFEWIEKGLDSRSPGVASLRALPYFPQFLHREQFIRFRNDARYYALLDRLKFPPLPPDHPGYAEEQTWLAAKSARQTTP